MVEELNEIKITGCGIGSGVAVGNLFFIKKQTVQTSESGEYEFWDTMEKVKEKLSDMYEKTERSAGRKNAELFEIYQMILDDDDFVEGCIGKIRLGMSASEAVNKQAAQTAEILKSIDDEYLSERSDDIIGLAVLFDETLSGEAVDGFPENSIIIADDLSPAQTVNIDRAKVKGIVTFGGSKTSHTSILARSLGIPAIVRAQGLSVDFNGCIAVIDAENQTLTVNPSEQCVKNAEERIKNISEAVFAYSDMTFSAADGRKIKVFANIGSPDEAETAKNSGADGIGLFRTEFLFLNKEAPPNEEEQFRAYKNAAEKIGGLTVIRTLDIGADKKPRFINLPREENPALGLRGIRVMQKYPKLFGTQIRAILRASAFGKIAVMFPMVSSVEEFDFAYNEVKRQMGELKAESQEFDTDLQIGVMIETPAAALISDELAEKADFFSIGSNDLCQYTYAADRQNSEVSGVIPDVPEAVIKLIKLSAENIHRYKNKWIGVCGELASDPHLTKTLIDAGVDELSMVSESITKIKSKLIEILTNN